MGGQANAQILLPSTTANWTADKLAARRLLTLRTDDFTGYVREVFHKLMAKSEAASRRAWMEEAGHLVEAD